MAIEASRSRHKGYSHSYYNGLVILYHMKRLLVNVCLCTYICLHVIKTARGLRIFFHLYVDITQLTTFVATGPKELNACTVEP